MFHRRLPRIRCALTLGPVQIVFGAAWIVVLPLLVWGVRVAYVPLLGAALSGRDAWLAAGTIAAVTLLALFLHGLAHAGVERGLGNPLPPQIPIYPLGDAAQVWPAGRSAAADAVAALAGPAASLLLALIALTIWNTQTGTFANTVSLFVLVFNAGLAAVNLAPAYPFDGGRLLRALICWRFRRPALGARLAFRLGLLLLLELLAWAAWLAWPRQRFSQATSLATVVLLALVALALLAAPAWRPEGPDAPAAQPRLLGLAGSALLTVVALAMAGAFALILPLNGGLEAPGSAVAVGPMVQVPPDRARTHAGTLLLTTVIPQAPIVVAEWLYAQFDHTIRLTPAQEIVPAGTTLQEEAVQGVQDLQVSEQTAIAVGLKLAGYQAGLAFDGAQITGIVPGSGAAGVLSAGDVIVAVNGRPVTMPSDIGPILAAAPAAATAAIDVERDHRPLTRTVKLTPPAAGATTPRIGVDVAPAGGRLSTPFPVTITPREIVGGPSAGLMLTLGVVNALSPDDVTAGHRIAGTGTIGLDGTVGPIGGVQQKVAAAEQAGATYFLCPPENYADARAAARRIQVVQVATVQQALAFLRSLPPAAG